MKKQFIYIVMGIVALLLVGCKDNQLKIDYLPVKAEKDATYWSFVDNDGNIVNVGEFKNCPSAVIDGIFSVQEDDETYSIYEFDKDGAKLLMNDLMCVGSPRNKILPICKKKSRIEIINTEGERLFSLENISGNEIVECASTFEYGYLVVATTVEGGGYLFGVVDEKGDVVLNIEYTNIRCLGENLFFVNKENPDVGYFVDADEKELTQWPSDIKYIERKGEYIIGSNDERKSIYDLNGKEVVKCSDNVRWITSIQGDKYSFNGVSDTEDGGGEGVMTLSGDTIIPPIYSSIYAFGFGYVGRTYHPYANKYFDKDGKEIKKTEDFFRIISYDGFGVICESSMDGIDAFVMGEDFEAKSKARFDISGYNLVNGYSYTIKSNYFDFKKILSTLTSALNDKLWEKGYFLGGNISECIGVTDKDIQIARVYSNELTKTYLGGSKFAINTIVKFDYNDLINSIVIEINVPHDNKSKFMPLLRKTLDDIYSNNAHYLYVSSSESFIIPTRHGDIIVKIIEHDGLCSDYYYKFLEYGAFEGEPMDDSIIIETENADGI